MSKFKKPDWYDVFGIIVTVSSIGLFCYFYFYQETKMFPTAQENSANTEAIKMAFDTYKDSFKSLATITIGLLVAVWGFIFSSKKLSKATLRLLMPLVGSSLFLVFSFVSYNILISSLIDVLYQAETLDLNAPIIQFWQQKQLLFFYCGFIVTIISFFLLIKKIDP